MFIIIWIVLCLIVGSIAGSRGKSSFLYFLLSAILSPLLGILILLIQPNENEKQKHQELMDKIDKLEKRG